MLLFFVRMIADTLKAANLVFPKIVQAEKEKKERKKKSFVFSSEIEKGKVWTTTTAKTKTTTTTEKTWQHFFRKMSNNFNKHFNFLY
jgi:hypothetical protein